MEHRIIRVEENSIAEELEIEAGDVLVSACGQEIEDVFDFRALTEDEEITLVIRKPDGEEWELEIEKDPYEDLGIVFESDLMSDYRSCTNQCVFCFIDQMPPGMRETLYFKDDDSRLSFLQGNYITLTNMKQQDIDRIIRYRMEPMNISVHTTDPELRCRMLHNRFAGDVLKYLKDLYEAGIHMNAQIVLCKGLNDGPALQRTIQDLLQYAPVLESVSVVPVGLTKYRDGLYPLEPFEKADAEAVIDLIEAYQKQAYEACGLHFVHASDEFYLLAGRAFPEEERYDGYLQIENGVGMARSLFAECEEALHEITSCGSEETVTFATGALSAPLLEKVAEDIAARFPEHVKPEILTIRNDFFGPLITVAGLITGQDLIAQLKGKINGKLLVLPNVMFRSGEEVFLDDVTRSDVEQALGVKTVILRSGGDALVHAMTGNLTAEDIDLTHGAYELS